MPYGKGEKAITLNLKAPLLSVFARPAAAVSKLKLKIDELVGIKDAKEIADDRNSEEQNPKSRILTRWNVQSVMLFHQ